MSGGLGCAARGGGLLLTFAIFVVLMPAYSQPAARPQVATADLVFELNPADTKVNFTLGATMHSVHGAFQLVRGRIEYTTAGGALRGEIEVDAHSGASGDASRDQKMHDEILESAKYPAITFRPDRIEGKLAPSGESTVQVHGTFSLHGVDHELTVPATVKLDGKNWTASAHFSVPYVQWGMKNPSVFLLRVNRMVDIDIAVVGTVTSTSR